jgi:crotonobetainyl-CoA:carnitine CoA-transferase CaiB-like acyl-CoA transferase
MPQGLPLQGLKVVDISQGIAGPHCAMLMALYGAEVIKIEPLSGDWMRDIGPRYGKQTAHSAAFNRGKKSIVLDLKNPAGLDAAHRLAAEADVFVENSRPGAVARLGLGYEALRKVNPKVVYVSISGFGQTGPKRALPGTDTVAQAFSGLMTVNRAMNGEPVKMGTFLIDAITGLYAFQAASMALFARRDGGEGAYIDVSLMQSIAAVLTPNVMEQYLLDGPPRLPNVPAGVYETSDGWMLATVLRQSQYEALCRTLGAPELISDPRYADFDARAENKDTLYEAIRAAFKKDTTANWVDKLRAADVLCSPVNSFNDWLADEHVQTTGMAPMLTQPDIGTVPVPNVPGAPKGRDGDPIHRLPYVGEHTREVLEGLGLDAATVDELAEVAKDVG